MAGRLAYNLHDVEKIGGPVARAWAARRGGGTSFDEIARAVLVARIVQITGLPRAKVFRLLDEVYERTGQDVDDLILAPGALYLDQTAGHPIAIGHGGQTAHRTVVQHEAARVEDAARALRDEMKRLKGRIVRLPLAEGVYLDRRHGGPVTASGVPIDSLATEVWAGVRYEDVAELFDVGVDEVRAAVRFAEHSRAA